MTDIEPLADAKMAEMFAAPMLEVATGMTAFVASSCFKSELPV